MPTGEGPLNLGEAISPATIFSYVNTPALDHIPSRDAHARAPSQIASANLVLFRRSVAGYRSAVSLGRIRQPRIS